LSSDVPTKCISPSTGTPGEGWGTPSAFLLTCKFFGAGVLRIKEL
jgi:hypothetical protein